MTSPRKHALDWDQPLLPTLTDSLLAHTRQDRVDLSALLTIVPTRQSGRRLRESLALAAAARGQALLPPQIFTPDSLLSRVLPSSGLANEAGLTAAWVRVWEAIDPEEFPAIVPAKAERSRAWELSMARRMLQLSQELGEEGLDFASAARQAREAGLEAERWRQLAQLEARFLHQLAQRQLVDPRQARREAATTFAPPPGVERILLLATPDPQALPLLALSRAAAEIPVEVWTYGPAECFDEWGRPLTELWTRRPLDLEGWDCRLHPVGPPDAALDEMAAAASGATPESILLATGDASLNPLLADALTRRGVPHYDPEGYPLLRVRLGRLAELLCQLAESADSQVVRSLLQHPDFVAHIRCCDDPAYLLRQFDACLEKHLAPDLETALLFAEDPRLTGALKAIQQLRQSLLRGSRFAQGLADALQRIFQSVEIDPGEPARAWREQADSLRSLIRELAEAEEAFPDLPVDLPRQLLLQGLRQARLYPDRPRAAHDLLGWLELLWNDAPHLLLAGLNEGKVPESVVGDAFLPESLREALGLRSNAQRFARDAYLLEALCRRRADRRGRIDIWVPQQAPDGSPLKPSRLLFLGPSDTLLPRVKSLFASPPATPQLIDHQVPWRLCPPPELPLPEHFSASALKSYLECPFRFFLRHILKMQPLDPEAREMSPAAFGSCLHAILAHLAERPLTAESSPQSLLAELEKEVETIFTRQFGSRLSFALRLQREAILTRIQYFVTRQCEDLQVNGPLQVGATEVPFALDIGPSVVRGIIDRVDTRADRVELLDYKTADSPVAPAQAHLAPVARKAPPAHLPEAAFFEHEDKRYRWTDLQLPLYAAAQMRDGQARPKVAYFNLAKTLDKSALSPWEDFSQSHIDSALACAAAVIEQIRAGVFWPPNPDVREAYDDFAPLFPDGLENSVEADAFRNYRFASVPTPPH